MNYSLLIDCAAVAILAISVAVMIRRGVFKSLYKIASIVLTVVAVLIFSGPAMHVMDSLGVNHRIDQFVSTAIISDEEDNTEFSENAYNTENLPNYFGNVIEEAAESAVVPAVSDVVKKLVCAVVIYVLTKIVLYLIFLVITGVFKLPILKSVNKLISIAAGLASGLIIIYLACGIASLNIANSAEFRKVVDNTYIVKYFYDQNVLFNLFLSD